MSDATLASAISLLVAITILCASFFQWWDITYNGEMKTRKWVKALFIVSIWLLIIATYFMIKGANK